MKGEIRDHSSRSRRSQRGGHAAVEPRGAPSGAETGASASRFTGLRTTPGASASEGQGDANGSSAKGGSSSPASEDDEEDDDDDDDGGVGGGGRAASSSAAVTCRDAICTSFNASATA